MALRARPQRQSFVQLYIDQQTAFYVACDPPFSLGVARPSHRYFWERALRRMTRNAFLRSVNLVSKVASATRSLSTLADSVHGPLRVRSFLPSPSKSKHPPPHLPNTSIMSRIETFLGVSVATSSRIDVTDPKNNADTAAEKPPAPVYELYSWRSKSPNARLVYIRNVHTANVEVARLAHGPLGFDMEWKPIYNKGQAENPVSLIQLANSETILLIQISAMPRFPEGLKELLSDPRVVKAGVGIQGDCKKLFSDWGVPMRNCVDLSLLARTVDNERWKGRYVAPIGLARLCEAYEELTLAKGKATRSNWEQVLTEVQQQYAANDGHVGYWLYCKFAQMASAMNPVPRLVYYTFDYLDGRLCDPFIGVRWSPDNPYYDPGPPPPPPPPRPPKDKKKAVQREGERALPRAVRFGDHPRASDVQVGRAPASPPSPRQVGRVFPSPPSPRQDRAGPSLQFRPPSRQPPRARGQSLGYREPPVFVPPGFGMKPQPTHPAANMHTHATPVPNTSSGGVGEHSGAPSGRGKPRRSRPRRPHRSDPS